MLLYALAFVQTVALVAVILILSRQHERSLQRAREERAELLTRIQHPELVPMAVTPIPQTVDLEPDELAAVGTINYQDEE